MLDTTTTSQAVDQAGSLVVKHVLPQGPVAGPYKPPLSPLGVPSLVWFCINSLYPHPDQVHLLNCRLNYRSELNDVDLHNLDPRVWATIVQLYDNLPSQLTTYELPLNDIHLPLLQEIPSTPLCSFLTILDLPLCPNLNDETISDLKCLHSLVALDASGTSLSPHGLQRLVNTLLPREFDDAAALRHHRGPWPLRILHLRNCKKITNEGYASLVKFPLLSIIDLRNTACTRGYPIPLGFQCSAPDILFHPTPLSESLSNLQQITQALYSSPNPFTLYVSALNHKKVPTKAATTTENTVVTFSWSSNAVKLDNANRIARKAESREDFERHAINKEAWYDRHEAQAFSLPVKPTMKAQNNGMAQVIRKKDSATSAMSAGAGQSRLRPPPLRPQGAPRPSIGPRSSNNTIASSSTSQSSFNTPLPQPVSRAPQQFHNTFNDYNRPSPTWPLRLTKPAVQRHTQPSMPTASMNSPRPITNRPKPEDPITIPPTTEPSGGPDSQFMLYRHPPPWDHLTTAVDTMKSDLLRRKESMKVAIAMRHADFASVDQDRAALAKRQLDNLVVRRKQLQSEFATPSTPVSRPHPNRNPFAKPHSTDATPSGLVKPKPSSTVKADSPHPAEFKKPLKPISTVPTPVFTQELLDTSTTENKKSTPIPQDGSLKRSASPSSMSKPVKRPRLSDPPAGSSTFDWRKWSKAPC